MAQLLLQRHSTDVHLSAARRHIRRCKQIKGGEPYAVKILSLDKVLQEKQKLTLQAKIEKEDAHDDVVLNDGDLDNSIRSLSDRCKQFDRENTGRPLLNQLFPGGKISGIIYAPLENEPDVAEQLLTRLDALEEGNPLKEHIVPIKTNIEKCRVALAASKESIKALKQAEALEEISKANLRQQYEFNYLDMVKEFGKLNAERFFPPISPAPKKKIMDADNSADTDG
ncbi:MAG: hypothetical protein P1P88_18145 [Bacteroidales bacterium]|nr:hypothetical protein [Bacteroidales bacterium]